ncbi:MAG TPA: nicotinate-nucleotide adenylyltransferase [Gemmataceae bacterium]|nr:nicotinate-nucleotide adenylyltransferase [Gemmataceae bacterium]
MRIGVFGGTFDPVHLGHLILAEQCREQGRLDEVWFVPAGQPPHKPHQAVSPFRHRAEMLRLATAGHAAFRVNELESERPGPSYTVDTLDELRKAHPTAEWFFLVGSDTLAELHEWRDPAGIVRRAGLLVMARGDERVMSADELRASLGLPEGERLSVEVVATPRIEIASRDLRRRAAEGRSLRYLVPRAVECYIGEKELYRDAAPTPRPPASAG